MQASAAEASGTLDDWHPVLLARDLRGKPLCVCLFGVNYVLFRTRSGRIGALLDCCPHRHMRLSLGRVEGEQIICPYHGWRLSPSGAAQTPARCDSDVQGEALDVAEHDNAIWVKRPATARSLPSLVPDGFHAVHSACRLVKAPVEILFDNFTEVEHTAFAHWKFGYDLKALSDIEHTVTNKGDHTLIEVAGPQKALPWLLEAAGGVRSGDTFRIRYQTFYRPLRAEFEWWWEAAATQKDRGLHFKEIAYFMQVDKTNARLLTCFSWNNPIHGRFGWNRTMAAALSLVIAYEINIDVWLVENVVHDALDLDDCALGRFDAQLRHHRRGLAAHKQHVEA
jgi:phenylpropionate dioxygenase-like ring-hydroxylating dioxygenase large terminal subunit